MATIFSFIEIIKLLLALNIYVKLSLYSFQFLSLSFMLLKNIKTLTNFNMLHFDHFFLKCNCDFLNHR